MNPGDFTGLAADYAKYRPGYSPLVLHALRNYISAERPDFAVADLGAGTGIWTRILAESGLKVQAVEPNDDMRQAGMNHTADTNVEWRSGTAEATSLPPGAVDWVTMASSFHWVKLPEGLKEMARVLKPRGYLTVLWNPRDIEGNLLHEEIESLIYQRVPELKRLSSGSSKHSRCYDQELVSSGDFEDVIFFEAKHEIRMSRDRYLGAWRSVNDIQAQAGPERFQEILAAIADRIRSLDFIVVPYKTRAWTARKRR